MTAKRYGQAKREVNANWPLISLKICETTIRQIWIELSAAGLITVALRNFYVQVNARLIPSPPNTSPSTGRDLVARAGLSSTVIVPVNRNAVLSSGSIEPGPTSRVELDPRAIDLDEDY